MGMYHDPDGFITALRVLARSIYDEGASARDINALRRNARADEMDLPIDDLCCRVIHRALAQPRRSCQPSLRS
jgi:hypothetical protein